MVYILSDMSHLYENGEGQANEGTWVSIPNLICCDYDWHNLHDMDYLTRQYRIYYGDQFIDLGIDVLKDKISSLNVFCS
jgi:hypothetical protein